MIRSRGSDVAKIGIVLLFVASTIVGVNHGLTADSYEEATIPDEMLVQEANAEKELDERFTAPYPLIPGDIQREYMTRLGNSDVVQSWLIEPTVLFFLGWYAEGLALFIYSTPWMQHPIALGLLKLGIYGSLAGCIVYGGLVSLWVLDGEKA